jgi:hypothetical protein
MASAYRVLVESSEGKRSLGISRCRWDDNIKVDVQEVGLEKWTILIWFWIGRVVGNEPSGSIHWGGYSECLSKC